ncbi:MAG: TatD family deoxyribonuclease [Balneola sp.]|nr:MAG: TatD family deoxyribonuclease [Balneola sp.]
MIDTHSHIYLEQFDDDRDEVMQRAKEAGVEAIFMPAIDFGSITQMEKLNYTGINFYKMAGLHPVDVKELESDFERKLLEYFSKEDFYGVGETGLDYYWSTDFVEEQKQSLRIHCQVAKEVSKPIILHNRDSTSDLLDIIEEQQNGSLSGIWHCFNGTVDEGKRAIDLGLHLGIGGVVTFKNGGVDKTVAQLPLEKMILETDAPYLSPTPKRGKRNEPAFLSFIAKKLSEIFLISIDDIIDQTTRTSKQLFSIK